MRLFSGKIGELSDELVKSLVSGNHIETEETKEVAKDLEAIFGQYLATDREISDRAKEMSQARPNEYGRLKRLLAEERGIKIGDEMLDYLLDQSIEMLMHSNNVDEVFSEDHVLRKTMRTILRKHLELDEAIDREVRGKLKHVQEGTRVWEVEYQRVMGDIERRKRLS
ncbi:MAG: DUF507 family protein [Polyangiaceae bacterium]